MKKSPYRTKGSGAASVSGRKMAYAAIPRPPSRYNIGSRIVDTIKNTYRNPGKRNPGARIIRPR
jgi:hypothetical protein